MSLLLALAVPAPVEPPVEEKPRGGGGGGGKVSNFKPSKRLWWLHREDEPKGSEKAAKKAARIIIQGVVAEVSKEEIQEAIKPYIHRVPEFDWQAFFAEARYQAIAHQTKNADMLTAILAKAQEQWEAEREEEEILLML